MRGEFVRSSMIGNDRETFFLAQATTPVRRAHGYLFFGIGALFGDDKYVIQYVSLYVVVTFITSLSNFWRFTYHYSPLIYIL